MKDEHLDQHFVIHDVTTLAFAAFCGVIGGALTQAWEVGVLMAGAILTLGILGMRISPVRRSVNRAVLAARETTR